MNLKSKIKEIEKNAEYRGVAAMLALALLLGVYQLGVWIGGIAYQLLGK